VALVGEQIEVQEGGVGGIAVQQRAVHADRMMVDPTSIVIQVEPVERARQGRVRDQILVGFEGRGIAESQRILSTSA
jgi:hypothetical protein